MISKGKLRHLRKLYRGLMQRKRFIENIAWQWEAESINGRVYTPEATRRAAEDFRAKGGFQWQDVRNSWACDNELHIVIEHPKKNSDYTIQCGKHREPQRDNPNWFELNCDWHGRPIISRPMTTAELADANRFTAYLDALGNCKLEDTLMVGINRRGKEDQEAVATVSAIASGDPSSR